MLDARRAAFLHEMGIGDLWLPREAAAQDTLPVAPAQLDAEESFHAAPAAKRPVPPALVPAPVRVQPSPPDGDRAGIIAGLDWEPLAQTVSQCTACGLCKSRTQTVFGVGDRQAPWMLVGEAPGAEEDARGEPFVGQAGRLLDNMLAALRLRRGDGVYIANVLKCRPPSNRNPEPHEVAACEPYLKRQIALIQPRLILVLGRFAAQSLLGTDASIASLRGRVHRYASGERSIPLVVTYHPAYLLRNLPDKAKSWADLCLAHDAVLAEG